MSKLTRRDFLSGTALAAASAALGPAARATASPLPARRAGANEKLRMAVIGVRGRGDAHLGAWLKAPDVEVAAVCDIDDNAIAGCMDKIQKATGKKVAAFKDMRKLFEDKSIDAVSVATCNHTHTLAGYWAVQAGKHAYVEKPMSHNVWEGRRLVDVAKAAGKVVAVGTQCRSMAGMRDAIAFLQAGKLGKVKVARGFCYKKRGSIGKAKEEPVPAGVDYDLWLGPAPERPFTKNRFHYNWHWHWDTGNGDLGNQGVHQMDIARWGVGKDTLPNVASSFGGRYGYSDDGETPNTQVCFLDYGDVQIVFEVRGLNTDKYSAVEKSPGVLIGDVFECADGWLVIPTYSSGVAYSPKGELIQKFGGGNDNDHFRNFIDAVKANDPSKLNATALDGHLSASLCHLPNISYRLGKPEAMSTNEPVGKFECANEAWRRTREHLKENAVRIDEEKLVVGKTLNVDPKAETIVNDPEACKLLTREYRKPFVIQ
jgi:predicted dehydrogenase